MKGETEGLFFISRSRSRPELLRSQSESGLVDGVRIEKRLFLRRKIISLLVQLGEEAAGVAGVAGAAMLDDFKEEGVAVAIHKPTQDLLRVAARFALLPKLFTRAAPVVHVAGFDGMTEGILIHPGHHDHTSTCLGTFLHNRWNEALIVVFEIELHQYHIEVAGGFAQEDSRLRLRYRLERMGEWPPFPAPAAPTSTR